MKTVLEYIWLDANEQLRSKIKVTEGDINKLELVPSWSYDGSSTDQAPGDRSDCILTPVKIYHNPFHFDGWLVMCSTEKREAITFEDSDDYWFGFEQEYFITNGSNKPLGWANGEPGPQGPYYCGVGASNVAGREVVSDHMTKCIDAEINITGTNAEVALGQWEYQVFSKGAKNAGDDLWTSRYILERVAEEHGCDINIEPKPIKGDWNGSGMHTNFSTDKMRNNSQLGVYTDILDKMKDRHAEHIAVYGKDNDQRMTGKHETASIDEFTYGEGNRGASVRIPPETVESNYTTGYLEDRRPASNANPYDITKVIIDTIV
jgi:glutamine synthetase|tara:strand:+ start:454 stop:1410 length:957 start_codon:yes stop_codon:yes gene_type:complete